MAAVFAAIDTQRARRRLAVDVHADAIESVNSVIRKYTRNRKIYPNEDSALQLIYIAIREASQRWTMPVRHWKEALNHFAIMFEGRLPELTSK